MRPPTVAITAGDPCGIGPEIILQALTRPPRARLIVIGDYAVFERTARRLGRRLPPWTLARVDAYPSLPPHPLFFLDCGHRGRFLPGRSSREAGAAALRYLECAVTLWREGQIQALVTAPVTKWAIGAVLPSFTGQTEYLAHAMKARDVVMMFISDRLRVALLTRHLPLSGVARAIDRELLGRAIRLVAHELRVHFRIPHPRLALCGLNPHAGEAGRCGTEEVRLMQPVLRVLRREGLICDGPFAADGFFACLRPSGFALRSKASGGRQAAAADPYDAVVCAYHDQGLIPFKMLARDRGCQLSVGLPIVRTSPDHGSGLDIAGRGVANPGSMRYALELAIRLTHRYQISGPRG